MQFTFTFELGLSKNDLRERASVQFSRKLRTRVLNFRGFETNPDLILIFSAAVSYNVLRIRRPVLSGVKLLLKCSSPGLQPRT